MSPIRAGIPAFAFLLLLSACSGADGVLAAGRPAQAHDSPMLPALFARVPLPGIKGHWGHPSVDYGSERVYLPAVDAGVLVSVDGHAAKLLARVDGLKRPGSALVLPGKNRVLVAETGSGELTELDAMSLARRRSVRVPGGCENLRLELRDRQVYVSTDAGTVEMFDSDSLASSGTLPMGGSLAGFQLARARPLILANDPSRGVVRVFDRARKDTLPSWDLHGARENFPLALDDRHRRAFVACRVPAQVKVLDMNSGQVIDSLRIGPGVKDVWYEPLRGRIFATCDDGTLWTYGERRDGTYAPVGAIRTGRGAATSVYLPALGRLYVLVPSLARRPAELLIFKTD